MPTYSRENKSIITFLRDPANIRIRENILKSALLFFNRKLSHKISTKK